MKKAPYVIAAVIAVIGASVVRYVTYTSAKPWSAPSASPDKRFEIRYYSTFSPRRFLPTSPGSGSDNIDGLIRLYDAKTGKLLNEAFRTHLSGYEALWSDDHVMFLGDDGFIWPLPK